MQAKQALQFISFPQPTRLIYSMIYVWALQ